jgi:molecular chaperone DnaK
MAKYVYGIDLGTTYSCIAYVDESGRANVIKNMEGTNTTPSVVNFASSKQVAVGQTAKDTSVIDPKNTVSLVKAKMGKIDFAIKYNGEDKSPEEVSAYILRKLAEDAAKEIDAEVKDVVITCPAYFGTAERTATKNAGRIAGLNVLEVISEPVAAAIYYGCTREHKEKTFLVYDLGGGTFDVTIMNISSEKIEVICADGDHDLGGKDWDAATMRYLADEFASQKSYDGDFDEYAQQDLRLKAERAKQQLSAKEKTPVIVEVAGERARIDFSREKFDEITSVFLKSTIDKTDYAISVAEKRGFKVDEILLVGGSTKMPQVTRILEEKYKIKPKILEPDESVAKGAAIHAVNVYINNQQNSFKWEDDKKDTIGEPLSVDPNMISIGGKKRTIVVATTKSFAVEVIYKETREQKCCNMIIKNNPMPDGVITVSKKFGTIDENQQNVEIVVYESDFMDEYFDVDEDYVIGTATLELPGNLPADSPIEITFSLNNEGILEVTGKDLTSNKEIHATMRSKNIMNSEKVEELKEKSKQVTVI